MLVSLFCCNRSAAETTGKPTKELWTLLRDDQFPESFRELNEETLPLKYKLYALNADYMKQLLDAVPDRNGNVGEVVPCEIQFPNSNGGMLAFKMVGTTLMEKELADKFPELKTYEGVATSASSTTIRVSRNKMGFDAMILSTEGTKYIDPIELENQIYYLVYHKRDLPNDQKDRFFEPSKKVKP